jgi:HEAT repeat protein
MLALIAFLVFQSASARTTLDQLLQRLPAVAAVGDNGIGKEKEDLTQQIRAFEGTAVPRLLGLLKSDDARVRELAGYVLRDIHGVQAAHLESLMEACRDGNGWIAPAIAHVGTPRAIAFLVENLEAHPRTHTQVTWALRSCGAPAAIALARCFTADSPVTEGFANCVGYVLGEMDGSAAPAIGILLDAATNKELVRANRSLAVEVIGNLGLSAHSTIPTLRALAAAEPELFSDSVQHAILGIGGPEAAEILADQLAREVDVCTLRDIAALGENGYAAGPEVVKVLSDEDPDVRVSAARTLGYIGYTAAVDLLVRETGNAEDWKLAHAAVVSLGRLGANRALPALFWTAANHWYPPVRLAARKALAVLRGTSEYVSRFHPKNFAFEFFDELDEERAQVPPVALPRLRSEAGQLSAAELASLSYTIEVREGDAGRILQRAAKPGCGLRVPGGLLLGATRGEWGGEIVLRRPDGSQQRVLGEHVKAIHDTPNGIVAVTGLAHLMYEGGDLYRVNLCGDGSYKATWWKRLPGEPSKSGMTEDGSLVVACRGGTIVVSPTGEIRMADAR